MKVAMISRTTLYTAKGGDTVQIIETARHLISRGVIADIKLTNEIIDYGQYDLLHFFNITRPADILYHINKSCKPFVITPILIDYSEYDRHYRKGLPGLLFKILSTGSIEYCKTLARWIKGTDTLMSYAYLLQGHEGSVRKIINKAALLLPNSDSEFRRIQKRYKYPGKYAVIPNGIERDLFKPGETNIEKDNNLVICVARIEGIKNQLNLIKALNNTRFKLLIIGSPAPNQPRYYEECKKIAAGNISFIDHVPQPELIQYYNKAKVHVLPSWFETTGLSSLEAAAMGCNIVITDKGDAKWYFRTAAHYCDPASPKSIYEAIEQASLQNDNNGLHEKIKESYTWHQASLSTHDAYKQVIAQHGT